jgi:glycosyltransferase involved in cell wall biosynthesis
MLPAAEHVVVPSQRLENIARMVWKQPPARMIRIPNGIPLDRYDGRPEAGSIPGLARAPGDVIVGTLAGLRGVKNLPRLVRAVAVQPPYVKLVIVGEGPERANILAEAQRLGISDRILLPGFLAEPYRYVGHFDIFALSSDSEQFPISLVEAMAAGLPVISTNVGDVAAMVAAENKPFIIPAQDEPGFAAALAGLAQDQDKRLALGAANKAVAARDYAESSMIEAYRRLYNI